ncbi:MAG: hypothetical protein UR12_C0021G0004 [candidate division TM6 bacterium GW2011_GWF2_30_66]|nr:MAG: hypothetical protein UR12_C0021G0004 [candidate division TM6 bacterium GW2011_GWF2_30_66]
MNTESFIVRSRQINGSQYGYEQTIFVNWKTPIVIICKVHGAFKQWPETHLKGAGCKRCKGIKAMAVKVIESANNFITRARKAHGEKYNYSKTIYIASHQKVVIICPNHGDFEQVASSHLLGSVCRLCAQELQKNINKKNFKKLTCEFIENARSIHGNKYDYKDVLYLNYNTPVKIICSFHGLFLQSPGIHLNGGGCKRCADIQRGEAKRQKAAQEFLSRVNDVHGSKYDYSKAKYVGSSLKLEIICKKHGSFLIAPNCLLRGQGCSRCGTESMAEKQSTGKNKFIEQAMAVHGGKYDYSKTIYVSTHRHVTIICLQHGFFSQAPSGHISGRGCPKCGIEKCAKNNMDSLEVFIEKAKMIHGEKYDYSKAIYKGSSTSLTIICTLHGPFLQRPDKHCGAGHGCPTCVNRDMDTEKFILRAQEVHRGKYNYKQSIYTIAKAKITIICPEHGLFEQVAWNHMAGIGCPLCVDQLNSRGVKRIEAWLGKNSISFMREKTFSDLRSHKRGNKHLRFDFFLTDLNVLIEFDGEQHFKPNKFWGGDESFNNLKSNDQRKNSWAIENGYNLLRINFNDKDNIESMLSDYLCNFCKFNTGYNLSNNGTCTETMNNKGQ